MIISIALSVVMNKRTLLNKKTHSNQSTIESFAGNQRGFIRLALKISNHIVASLRSHSQLIQTQRREGVFLRRFVIKKILAVTQL
jgi:hypothetical protein